ncbi:MAG TPA: flagellar biosynthetic protein FliR [Candidatus Angelobacter sp.]|nr:flagellar biosynthetic protein FliR [Candidatus Angelobacter sp.]
MPVLHLDRIVEAAVFAGVRIGGIMIFPPFFGSDAIPIPMKAAFTIFLTALLYPVYGPLALRADAMGWVRVAAGELVIGLVLGLSLQFVFEAALAAGQMVGIQTGFSLITILDPQTQADTQVLAIFHQFTALLIFLQLNVHHWLLRGLAASFAYLPPGSAFVSGSLAGGLLHAAGAIWLVALQIAMPVIAATMIVDIVLGFVAKASPQFPLIFAGLSIKNILGVLALAGTLRFWPSLLERQFTAAIMSGEHLLHLAH